MNKEDKDLLLRDLCARLPYRVKIVIQDTFEYSIVPREYHVLDVSNFSDIFCFNYKKFDKRMIKAMRERPNYIVFKPYLFPLSSMTEEQEEEFKKLYYRFHESAFIFNERFSYDRCSIKDIGFYPSYLQDWLNKNHFDYRGLIPMGLAIDATGLNIY